MYLVVNKEYLYWTISGDTEVGNCHTISLGGKEYSSTLFKGQVLLQSHLITKNRSDTSLAIPLPFQVNITKYSLGGKQSCLEQGMYLQNSQYLQIWCTHKLFLSDTMQDSLSFRVLVRFCTCCFEMLRQASEPLPTWADTTLSTAVQFRPD